MSDAPAPTPADGPEPAADAPSDAPVTDRVRSAAGRVLDVVVFVPVGFAADAVEQFPKWAAKGRDRLGMQVSNARVAGHFVVHKAQRDVGRRVDGLRSSARRAPSKAPVPPAASGGDAGTAPRTSAPPPPPPPPAAGGGPVTLPSDRATTAAAGAAIEGYDTLSASQVVRRLDGLGPDELRAVYRHEAATRGRRTILHRVQQLLAPAATTPEGRAGGSDAGDTPPSAASTASVAPRPPVNGTLGGAGNGAGPGDGSAETS